MLIGQVRDRLEQILRGVAEEKGIEILNLSISPDHLHLFVSCYPRLPVHKIVKAFKGRSSRILRQEFSHLLKLPSLWTHSYFVSTAGNVSSVTIQKYIEDQSKI